ncbi:MAG: hypothetical protein ABFS32_03020 [Bacteroidota bacterium]
MRKTSLLFISLLIAAFAGLVSCSNSDSNDEKQKAYDKVIAVHDEVMPKLSQISNLKEQITKHIAILNDSTEIAEWQQLIGELDDADESMWVWMRQFDSYLDDKSEEEALEYLKEEQVKVDEVARKINESIAKAEEMFEVNVK